MPNVVVIGAGPAGLGAAWKLAVQGEQSVHVLERGEALGGNAGSFEVGGLRVDYGSHRLHPACDPGILSEIRGFLGDDLLDRPRHGRILLLGRWVHFPLKPADLLTHLPLGFAGGALFDSVAKRFSRRAGEETFATVLQAGLGPTICREFYFPYAEKIWGLQPSELHAEQARRRVSASSTGKLIRKVLSAVPGFKPPGSGRFFYPRRGFGAISEAYGEAAAKAGARILRGAGVTGIERVDKLWRVHLRAGGEEESIDATAVFSTVPMPVLARLLRPPAAVTAAAQALRYRAMMLIYIVVDKERYTEFDAHYFPGREIPITRMSEPKNYGLAQLPGRTVLCAELPCDTRDEVWAMNDAQLGQLFADSLRKAGLPAPGAIGEIVVKRLAQAYPIYTRDFFEHFAVIDSFLEDVPGVLTFGRQGLFVHDNTHHALRMAHAAVECFRGGSFDRSRWRQWRQEFASNVVED